MKHRVFALSFIVIGVLFLSCQAVSVRAGGINLRNPAINGLRENAQVPQKGLVTLCYNITEYLFSGHGENYAYIPFMIGRPIRLRGSVGREGKNFPADVRLIKKLLKRIGFYTGAIDNNAGEKLYEAIERFQRSISLKTRDGRIDLRGKTLWMLKVETADAFFVKLGHIRTTPGVGAGHYDIRDCVNFEAPGRVSKYQIYYSLVPLIIDYKIGTEIEKDGKKFIVLNIDEQRTIRELFRRNPPRELATISVVAPGSSNISPIATYLRLNNRIPGLQATIVGGESDEPVTFSWHTKPRIDAVQFRYRLYPDSDWSPWGHRTRVDYFFLGIGSHTFAVETRYRDASGAWKLLPVSDYSFYLEHPFISQPVIYKASGGHLQPSTTPSIPDFKNLYTKSRALLVGVSDFSDQTLSPLPFVKQDVARMKEVLSKQGFEVTEVVGSKTRAEIIAALEDFLAKLEPNDRVLVYFSTHGFQDKVVKSRAYLAAADCDPDKPALNCISLESLENILNRAIQLPVRHLLIVLDSCSAGLGVITKSPEYKELNVAVEPGAHMITAGLADQEAVMDVQRRMSTFTWYFAKGMEGAADYTKDNIITLTELLLYTRYHVAKKTDGAQTPMIGRLKGPGEMVFKSKP